MANIQFLFCIIFAIFHHAKTNNVGNIVEVACGNVPTMIPHCPISNAGIIEDAWYEENGRRITSGFITLQNGRLVYSTKAFSDSDGTRIQCKYTERLPNGGLRQHESTISIISVTGTCPTTITVAPPTATTVARTSVATTVVRTSATTTEFFITTLAPTAATSEGSDSAAASGMSIPIIAGVVVVVAAAILLVVVLLCVWISLKSRKRGVFQPNILEMGINDNSHHEYSKKEKSATFEEDNCEEEDNYDTEHAPLREIQTGENTTSTNQLSIVPQEFLGIKEAVVVEADIEELPEIHTSTANGSGNDSVTTPTTEKPLSTKPPPLPPLPLQSTKDESVSESRPAPELPPSSSDDKAGDNSSPRSPIQESSSAHQDNKFVFPSSDKIPSLIPYKEMPSLMVSTNLKGDTSSHDEPTTAQTDLKAPTDTPS